MSTLTRCPRCQDMTLETLNSHQFCWECGYSPDFDEEAHQALNAVYRQALGRIKAREKLQNKKSQGQKEDAHERNNGLL